MKYLACFFFSKTHKQSRVYIFGGLIGNTITDELLIYNLETDEWIGYVDVAHSEVKPAVGHSAHFVGNNMYVFFGHNPEYGYMNDVQLFAPGMFAAVIVAR